jgi:hypothetical protein
MMTSRQLAWTTTTDDITTISPYDGMCLREEKERLVQGEGDKTHLCVWYVFISLTLTIIVFKL